MDYRPLGASGLKVPALSFGAGTFGGSGPLFGHWGNSDAKEARRLVDICLEAGVNLFDTADVYSNGASEEVLGEAIKGRRDAVLISTKTSLPMGDGPADWGSSRSRLIRSVDVALKRLGTDYIDLLQLHAFDASTPVEEVLSTLDDLVRQGKLRYVGVSNFSGWQAGESHMAFFGVEFRLRKDSLERQLSEGATAISCLESYFGAVPDPRAPNATHRLGDLIV
ncbi:aldo/keto reductase, partial [Mesorhizobium sp. B3-1-6]|uniref:aldo/keto reductase n=1 Tax=Mesorhizobium sp. B3-1-6 TaxID=2589895 RepID=UPI001FEF14CB